MATYRAQGIILRRSNFGEANLLLHIYSKELGKIEAVGRSARKAQGKLKGHLEPFLHCDFTIVHGRKMDIVANSSIVDNFLNLRTDLDYIMAASVIAETADRMTVEGYRDERLYYLLLESFRFLDENSKDRKSLWLLVLFFQINILSLSGFSPHMGDCVFCAEKLAAGKNYFSRSLGGVLDEQCARKCPDARRIDDDMIRLIKFLQVAGEEDYEGYVEKVRATLQGILKINVKGAVIANDIFLMKDFIGFNLDEKIKSLDIFCSFSREGI